MSFFAAVVVAALIVGFYVSLSRRIARLSAERDRAELRRAAERHA